MLCIVHIHSYLDLKPNLQNVKDILTLVVILIACHRLANKELFVLKRVIKFKQFSQLNLCTK